MSSEEQTFENQRPDVEGLVRARRLELVERYEERASAAKARPAFDRMLEDARRGRFDVLVVWALDRFGRSMVGNVQAVLELERQGVEVLSVREPWLDTGGPVRSLLLAVFGWIAEQERLRLSERTRAGMERVRRTGKHIGRPPARVDVARARRLQREGLSLPDVARRLGVSASTLKRSLSSAKSRPM